MHRSRPPLSDRKTEHRKPGFAVSIRSPCWRRRDFLKARHELAAGNRHFCRRGCAEPCSIYSQFIRLGGDAAYDAGRPNSPRGPKGASLQAADIDQRTKDDAALVGRQLPGSRAQRAELDAGHRRRARGLPRGAGAAAPAAATALSPRLRTECATKFARQPGCPAPGASAISASICLTSPGADCLFGGFHHAPPGRKPRHLPPTGGIKQTPRPKEID